MKRLVLRFQNYKSEILSFAFIAVLSGLASVIFFSTGKLAVGIIMAVVCLSMITLFAWYASRIGIILDFSHNRLKMKSRGTKSVCTIDEIRKMEIIFHREKKMNGFSAQVKVHLKNGSTIAVNFNPQRRPGRYGYTISGEISYKRKAFIESQVKGIYFITCRTV